MKLTITLLQVPDPIKGELTGNTHKDEIDVLAY